MEDDALAEDLRQAIGELVRAVRTADTMPPERPPSSATSIAAARRPRPHSRTGAE